MENLGQDLRDLIISKALKSHDALDMTQADSDPQINKILESIIWEHAFKETKHIWNPQLSLSDNITFQIEQRVSESIHAIEPMSADDLRSGFSGENARPTDSNKALEPNSLQALMKNLIRKGLTDVIQGLESISTGELDSIGMYVKDLIESRLSNAAEQRGETDSELLKINKELDSVKNYVEDLMHKRLTVATETLELMSSVDKECDWKKIGNVDQEEDVDIPPVDHDEIPCFVESNAQEVIDYLKHIEEEDECLLKRLQSAISTEMKCMKLDPLPSKPRRKVNKELDSKSNWLGNERLNENTAQQAEKVINKLMKKGRDEATKQVEKSVCHKVESEWHRNIMKTKKTKPAKASETKNTAEKSRTESKREMDNLEQNMRDKIDSEISYGMKSQEASTISVGSHLLAWIKSEHQGSKPISSSREFLSMDMKTQIERRLSGITSENDATEYTQSGELSMACKDISMSLCKMQESAWYKNEMKIKRTNLAAEQKEQKKIADNLEDERKRKIIALKRLEYLDQVCASYAEFSTELISEIIEISEQSDMKWKRRIASEDLRMVEYSLPRFFAAFDKWCYAKQCEYFLNQMSPMQWRVKNDHIFHHQFNKLSDQEKSSIVSSKYQIIPPLEYVHYTILTQEDSKLFHNDKNAYDTFKRDLERRGNYVPVPRPYFKKNSQLSKRLEQIEEGYLQTLHVFVGIKTKRQNEEGLNEPLRQRKRMIETQVEALEEKLVNERKRLHHLECELKNTGDDVMYDENIRKILKKGKIMGNETLIEFTKRYHPEHCFSMDCVVDTMLDDLMEMVYLFEMGIQKNIGDLKQKRLESKANQSSARTLCRWTEVLRYIKENKIKMELPLYVQTTQPHRPQEKPFMFRSMPEHTQKNQVLPCILKNIKPYTKKRTVHKTNGKNA